MRNSIRSPRRSYVERLSTDWRCFFIFVVQLTAAGAALAQNARTPPSDPATTSSYVVDGLALGARVDFETPAYRGYQCSPSELFPDFTRCQRTQRQQDGSTRRSFETSNSILHGRDGKAVYINRYIVPWTFDRNEIQSELKQISSKLGEHARERRLPQREGLQTAMIAVWGKIELTQLDADAIAILAAGESPRKGLLIDYLGNLRRSAQLGLPVFRINGGPGYLWSASVDRNNRGHIRILAVDAAALSAATAASVARPAEAPLGEILPKNETAATEKGSADTEPVLMEAEKTSIEAAVPNIEAEIPEAESAEAAVPEPDKIAPLLARLEGAEARSCLIERMTYWTLGGLVLVVIFSVYLLCIMRERSRAPNAQIPASEKQPTASATRAQTGQTEHRPARTELSSGQSAVEVPAVARAEAVADAKPFQNRSVTQKQEARLAEVNDRKDDGAQHPSTDVIEWADCRGAISRNDKVCMHWGASVAPEKRTSTTQLCSSCRQEIGASDKFCRYCGTSYLAVSATSIPLNATSVSPIASGMLETVKS